MQWILQDFEDTRALADVLDRAGLPHSWHKVVPFVGDLVPPPVVPDPQDVILFGAYALWRYAEARGYRPGIVRLRPYIHEAPWQPHMLNGPDALLMTLRDVPDRLPDDGRAWFLRPVDDSKAIAGGVKSGHDIHAIARKVLALDPDDIPGGSLRPDTDLLVTPPARIQKEWRLWIVSDRVVTHSLYKDGARVVYRPEIDDDALAFARDLIALNPAYAPAYVMDICRTTDGLRLLETNCLNAAGFYAADLDRLVAAIEAMDL
ncbi:MAG: ATP-grasp domain-containing protein [Pseudomonadota bacterium]